jgi:hypothetical protein
MLIEKRKSIAYLTVDYLATSCSDIGGQVFLCKSGRLKTAPDESREASFDLRIQVLKLDISGGH